MNFSEILVILGVTLIVFGPERLPEIAGKLGRILGEIKRHSDGFRREFYNAIYEPAKDTNNRPGLIAQELKELGRDVKQTLLLDPNCPDSASQAKGASAPPSPTSQPAAENTTTSSTQEKPTSPEATSPTDTKNA